MGKKEIYLNIHGKKGNISTHTWKRGNISTHTWKKGFLQYKHLYNLIYNWSIFWQ